MNQYAITYQAASRRAAVKVVDKNGALGELERRLHFAPNTSKAYARKIRSLIESGAAGDKYEFFDGYIVVIANESAAEQRGIERARKVVEAAEVRNQHHQDLKLDLLDALTEARTETEE